MTGRRGAVAVALAALAVTPALAQTVGDEKAAPAEPLYFEVTGLSPGDELNLRANASPTGMMIGRMPFGSVVRNLGCADVGKYRWCKIADVNNDVMQGWAAARYLAQTQYEEPRALDAPAGDPDADATFPDIDNSGASILPE